ncbi:gliding motility-associated C-terminal domain-containing protein [Flagellimonas taeanensis]|uniref:gliding motility-associated C-terminal domain-containing protein n=1 Tax=Flavobacteriaceae TaxID=49546 RepID=UPI000E67CB99|nr:MULTISPECIES: gliding motility-associated C-terminal domain-containing protein [Allomuricauda]MDC6384339.1 gliding motility-associated C-terminal domain-containing protein [Muricauda sp. SK9]RIV49690.1 gliding motility-associated C-terminal domain-containing protein [Allomuricauda taeanensis]RIV53889.1 gliding motility-associated C-terminal domain-containing protein [Allomuricauda taeanensis]
MKPLHLIAFLLFAHFAVAQSALHHAGNMRVHFGGSNSGLGLHTNFTNNAPFEQNEGLVGFYGNSSIQVRGNTIPTFRDVEFMATSEIFLHIPVQVQNNANFIEGNVNTPTDDQTVYLNFMEHGFSASENDDSKVTGFAAVNNRDFFRFPVGDHHQLRTLTMESEGSTPLAVCAYFFEDPSTPLSVPGAFDVEEKVRDIGTVTNREFWIFQSDVPAKATISWNTRSALGLIPNATLEAIIVVGWSKSSNQWVIIGNSAISGDVTEGFVTSETFVPSDYAAITFGTIPLPTDTFAVNNPTLGNYFLSPNGDGVNDFLVIDNMDESPNNSLRIFNRLGQKVFEKINYTNEFRGDSNTGSFVMSQDVGLPEGIYYYLVTLDDLNLQYTGFLFLDR